MKDLRREANKMAQIRERKNIFCQLKEKINENNGSRKRPRDD